ncbi:MAG: IclR family transcriptional regulator [Candidatus Solibacter sp.]|jgi:DNA-binding IclR family transcriptional regulator
MQALKTTSPPAVDRALTILEVLAHSTRGLRLPEIALRLGLPKSSAHSLLVGLERRGYLQRCETSGRYRFGPKILSLANVALCGMTLRDIAFPVLTGVMRSTGLAVKMAILDRDQAVLIEQVHPAHVSAPMTWLGKRLDLHSTALGKVLAAFQPREQWSRLITEHRLPRHNNNTICSPRRFLRELALTRERGYALDNEEFDLGMRCLSVPLCGSSGETVAAIGITGTTSEIHEGNLESLLKLLTTAAATISAALTRSTEGSANEAEHDRASTTVA